MMNLAEYRNRNARLADFLPWVALAAPGIVLNKDGSFQRTARFRGSAATGAAIVTSTRTARRSAATNPLATASRAAHARTAAACAMNITDPGTAAA